MSDTAATIERPFGFADDEALADFLDSLHETEGCAITNNKWEAGRLAAAVIRSPGLQRIVSERLRQVEKEGWTPEHDDDHADGELATAAACYAFHAGLSAQKREIVDPTSPRNRGLWPWEASWWRPGPDASTASRARELEKAGALIAAELERLLRLEQVNATTSAALAPEPTLQWSPTLCDGKRVDHATAEQACGALGDGWRLPTRHELESILDLTRHDPAVDTDRFPDTKSGWYWTSTPCAWSSVLAWCVFFYDGGVDLVRRDYDFAFARAVRSVPAGQ